MMPIVVRQLGMTDYPTLWANMQSFNAQRNAHTLDQIWITEHYPVYTLGLAGRREHLHLPPSLGIPIIACDRGGQVTYHAPGQVMVYTLIDLSRQKIGVRRFVALLEQSVIEVLATYNIPAHRFEHRPGVYVDQHKISALGLRVKRGACYHGLALNVSMNLSPFRYIDPCGYPDMQVTELAQHLASPQPPSHYGEQIAQRINGLLLDLAHPS